MGGTTPRFGIRFPYQGEPVTLAHFKNLADDVDSALINVLTLRGMALNLPAAKSTGPFAGNGATAFGPGVVTTMLINGGTAGSTLWYDNDAMFTVGANDRLTCKTAGIYVITGSVGSSTTTATTINNFGLQLVVTGAKPKTFEHKQNTETMTQPGPWAINGVWQLAVNDFVQIKGYWDGVGTMTPTNVTLGLTCVALV